MSYQIFVDATADMSKEMFNGLPGVEIIPMEVMVGDEAYIYGPNGNLTVEQFYAMQRSGKYASTTQITPDKFRAAFEPYLQNGIDILYLGFSSGMSGTVNSANICARELEEEYPERRIICVDTLCGSVGEGFLARETVKKQAQGMEIEELAEWVLEHRLEVCHWFTVDTFDHLLHGGRVSAASAVLGTALKIKPMLHITEEGKLQVAEKPRGNKQAMKAQLARMEQDWMPEQGKFVLVGQGDCPENGKLLCEEVAKRFPEAEIVMTDIGPVIGAHTGPGMVALIYWGSNR